MEMVTDVPYVDFFGQIHEYQPPVALFNPKRRKQEKLQSYRDKIVSPEQEIARENRAALKLAKQFKDDANGFLFEEIFNFLKAPLMELNLPSEFISDCKDVAVEEPEEDDERAEIDIPYEPRIPPAHNELKISGLIGETTGVAGLHRNFAVEDRHDMVWSLEGLLLLQVRMFWRSLEELGLSNNELEKWSALKWIFKPAIWYYRVWDARINKSHCMPVHERDDPFSFANCCIAARMDADAVRDGVQRNIPADLYEAIERVNDSSF